VVQTVAVNVMGCPVSAEVARASLKHLRHNWGITFFSPPLPPTGAAGPEPDAERVTSVAPIKLSLASCWCRGDPRAQAAARGWECSLAPR
jgi:hypothetical protein